MESRVKLLVDLTRYDSRLTGGQLGTTNMRDRSGWSAMDRFVKVRFDCGAYLDILWRSLEIIPEPKWEPSKGDKISVDCVVEGILDENVRCSHTNKEGKKRRFTVPLSAIRKRD